MRYMTLPRYKPFGKWCAALICFQIMRFNMATLKIKKKLTSRDVTKSEAKITS